MPVSSHTLIQLSRALACGAILSITASGFAQFAGFSPAQTYLIGQNPLGLAIGDFNSDGIPDIVASSSNSTLSVLLGTGGGAFAPPMTVLTELGPSSIVVADFNLDGALDLAVENSGGLAKHLGSGVGTFFPALQSTLIGQNRISHPVVLGEICGDAGPDLVGWSSGGVKVSCGASGAGAVSPAGSDPYYFISVGYFDSDSMPDIAVANQNSNTVSVLRGGVDGQFLAPVAYSVGDRPQGTATGDFNGDGFCDLAVSNFRDNSISILLGNGTGSFAPQQTFPAGTAPYALAVADFDGDQIPDIAVQSGSILINGISILFGLGTGAFSQPQFFSMGVFPSEFAVADLNYDGYPDIAATSAGNFNAFVIMNLAGSELGQFALTAPPDGTVNLALPETVLWSGAVPSLSWQSPIGLNSTYTLKVATNPALTNIVILASGLTEPKFVVPGGVLQRNTTYYWGVTASNAAGVTPSTPPVFSFRTIPTCEGDANIDGIVNFEDITTVLAQWLNTCP